jgi:hypothetical protein
MFAEAIGTPRKSGLRIVGESQGVKESLSGEAVTSQRLGGDAIPLHAFSRMLWL